MRGNQGMETTTQQEPLINEVVVERGLPVGHTCYSLHAAPKSETRAHIN